MRSGSTVNRYKALLSGVCKRVIKEEFMSANPRSQIDEEPENNRARYLTVEEQVRLFAVAERRPWFSVRTNYPLVGYGNAEGD